MRIYTKKGDTGTTGLLFGGARVSKADLRTDAYGTTDEAVSALGLARAAIGAVTDRTEAELARLIVRLQRELFVVGGELATHVDRRQKLTDGVTRVTAEMVTWLEGEIDAIEAGHEMPAEFVLPGEGSLRLLSHGPVRRGRATRSTSLSSASSAPLPSAQRTPSSLLRTSSPSTIRMLPALMGSAGPSCGRLR